MPDQPKKKVPLGRVKPRTEEELDALSAVSPADLIAAGELWRRAASPAFKALLDAEPYEPDA